MSGGLLVLLGEGLAACIVAGVWHTTWVLTHPPRRTYAHAVARGRPGTPGELPARADGTPRRFESWTFRSRGLDLPVWDIEGDAQDGPVVVLTHGWGDSRIGALSRVGAWLPRASRAVLWDMPGQGEAPGRCSLGTHEVEDLLALLDRLGDGGGDNAGPLVLFGWSLGAGVSIAAAARRPDVRGVVAEAPYRLAPTPARNVLKIRGLPYRWNVAPAFGILGVRFGVGTRWAGFDRAEHAGRMACPLMVIHGALDDVCPPLDGREIASAGRGEFVPVPDAGHHGLWADPRSASVCESALERFLASIEREEKARASAG